MKQKINSITHTRTFYMHNIHAVGIIRKEYINASNGRIIHTLFYEQAVCKRGTKWENTCQVLLIYLI